MDVFAVLGVERRPWLDAAELRRAFQERARELHPDADAGDAEAFAALNAAYAAVRDPAERLRRLGAAAGDGGMDFEMGFRIGAVLREAESMGLRLDAARTMLDRALLLREATAVRERVREVAQEIEHALAGADADLLEMDRRWPEVDAVELGTLAGRYRFLNKWRRQAREQAARLER